jgi:D-lactate dehydrogenase (cytochrome)
MVSNNASGARSFHYGSIRPWIHALQVVLPHGETVRIERGIDHLNGFDFTLGSLSGTLPEPPQPSVKNAAGYFVQPNMDLVDLFIGAEGTLGVLTEITLQLLPCPATLNGLLAFFPSEKEALDFVIFLRQAGNAVAIEFFDTDALDLLRESDGDFPKLKPEFHTAIYFEYESDVPESVLERTDELAIDCWFAEGEREIQPLKVFRHALPESVNQWIAECKREFPELTKLGTDMAVPDNQLEAVMQMYRDGLARADLKSVIFGHIGNNHLHVNILPRNMEEYAKGTTLYFEWAEKVVAMGGSVSAEHGIGKNKTAFLKLMMGEKGIADLQKIKVLFDPHTQLNSGNILD